MIQASLVKALPLEGVNSALYFLHVSLLHAWTAFEYKWYPMGIGNDRESKQPLEIIQMYDRVWQRSSLGGAILWALAFR